MIPHPAPTDSAAEVTRRATGPRGTGGPVVAEGCVEHDLSVVVFIVIVLARRFHFGRRWQLPCSRGVVLQDAARSAPRCSRKSAGSRISGR
jgi:hypothetical protein